MAITHTNFLTQVRNYTEVDSNVLSDTILDQFIRNVELDIAGQVDYDDLRKYANSNTTLGNRYCLLYTSPSPRDLSTSRMPSSA